MLDVKKNWNLNLKRSKTFDQIKGQNLTIFFKCSILFKTLYLIKQNPSPSVVFLAYIYKRTKLVISYLLSNFIFSLSCFLSYYSSFAPINIAFCLIATNLFEKTKNTCLISFLFSHSLFLFFFVLALKAWENDWNKKNKYLFFPSSYGIYL